MNSPERVVVTVAEGHVGRIQQVAEALRHAGLEGQQILSTSGIITRNVKPAPCASLTSVPGVMAVEDDQGIQLAPPDSKIQQVSTLLYGGFMVSYSLSWRHSWHLLVVTCSIISLSACGLSVHQRAAVNQFSTATMDFATLTSTELVKSRTDVIEMNTLRVQLRDSTVQPERIDGPFTVENVKARVEALNAFKDYAALLHTLVSTSHKDQLQTAADTFITSLRKVPGVQLSDTQAGAVGSAIQEVGGLVIEHMRAKAARTVVTATHDTILQLLELVRRDFSPTAEHWSLGYDLVITGLQGAAALAARGPDAAASAALIGEARVTAAQNRQRFDKVAKQVESTAVALRAAQINLRYALQSTDVSLHDIRAYAAQIQDFVSIYRILREK